MSAPDWRGVARLTPRTSSGVGDARRHAAQQQALRPHCGRRRAAAVRFRRSPGRRAVARAVVDKPHDARASLRHAVLEVLVDVEHDVEIAARGCASRSRRAPASMRHLLPLEEVDERRRALRADHRQRERARLVRLAGDEVEDQHQEERARDARPRSASPASCGGRARRRRFPCARRQRCGRAWVGQVGSRRGQAARPSPLPSSATKASSSVAAPDCATSSAAVPGGDHAAARRGSRCGRTAPPLPASRAS